MRGSTFLATSSLMLAAGLTKAVTLDSYTFNDSLMGNSVSATDGGAAYASNWLNTVNAAPGLTGALTGANFDTGIANIGLTGPVTYTIDYNTGILNGSGDDLGIVVARFSSDNIAIAFSTDGVTFGSTYQISAASAVATSVAKNYYYNGAGPFGATLFVHSLDLSSYGVLSGQSVEAIQIGVGIGSGQLDLIRVGGFGTDAVPEPASMAALGFGALALFRRRRKG